MNKLSERQKKVSSILKLVVGYCYLAVADMMSNRCKNGGR